MRKNYFVLLLFFVWMCVIPISVTAEPGGPERHHGNTGFSLLSQINLSTEQTEQIREVRLSHQKSIAPLRRQEHQIEAELDILWLQLTPDREKIRAAQKKIHDIKFQILEQETDFRIAIRSILTQDQLSRFLALGGSRRQGPDKFDHRPPRPLQPERY